ncbi:MAG: cation:proton antiporter [Phycisphaeraceae bacterium]|nr:cation:proton antiporter [Phycisphaeraceae bacterium]
MTERVRILIALAALLVFGVFVHRWPGAGIVYPQATDALGFAFRPHSEGLMDTALGLGLLMLGAWLAGRLAAGVRLPKISAYLVFGAVVGPDAINLVTEGQLPNLRLIDDLAIALIALTAGGEIEFHMLRRQAKSVLLVTLGAAVAVFALLTPAVVFARDFFGFGDVQTMPAAVMIGLLVALFGTATSPAVVIATLADLHARGPLSRLSLSVAVLWDLALVVLFAVLVAIAGPIFAHELGADAASAHDEGSLVLSLAQKLGGSLVLGAFAGMALTWYLRRVRLHLPIVIVLSCFAIALVAEALHLKALIASLVAGLMLRNIWEEDSEPLFETVEELSLPVYCVFFAVAGARIDLDLVTRLWPAALTLVTLRTGLVWVGAWAGARAAGEPNATARWVPSSMIAQAGVSVALAGIFKDTFDEAPFADSFFNLVLVAIAIHQLVGPVLFQIGLMRAGEVGIVGNHGGAEEDSG